MYLYITQSKILTGYQIRPTSRPSSDLYIMHNLRKSHTCVYINLEKTAHFLVHKRVTYSGVKLDEEAVVY